jgi:hypothetical protein
MPKESPQPSQQSSFLTKPRGSAKSTRLHTEFSDAHLVVLLAEESHQHLQCNSAPFADERHAVQPKTRVLIDKKQRGSRRCRP